MPTTILQSCPSAALILHKRRMQRLQGDLFVEIHNLYNISGVAGRFVFICAFADWIPI